MEANVKLALDSLRYWHDKPSSLRRSEAIEDAISFILGRCDNDYEIREARAQIEAALKGVSHG